MINLWVLILYSANLPRSFVSSGNLLMEFFESSKYRIMSSADRDNLSFLKISGKYMPFIYVDCVYMPLFL